MKRIKDYINEKLIVNNTIQNSYDPDNLNNDKILLYDDNDINYNDISNEVMWEDLMDDISKIDKKYTAFTVLEYIPKHTNYKVLSHIKDPIELDIRYCDSEVQHIFEDIVTGKDLGYAVRLQGGHLEIDCINSGSKSTYSIYALSEKMYDMMIDYLSGSNNDISLDDIYKGLMTKGNIVEIKDPQS